MKKIFTLGLSLAFASANLSAQTLYDVPVSENLGCFDVQHISADGKYLSGYARNTGQPIIADWQNDNLKLFSDLYVESLPWVTNSGIAVGHEKNDKGFKLSFVDGSATIVDQKDANGNFVSCEAISEDGTIIAGTIYDKNWDETACYWENGERHALPTPTSADMGFEVYGSHAQFISKDGSVIVGYLCTLPSMKPMIIWNRQADGTYECDPVCANWVRIDETADNQKDKPYKMFAPAALSPDGKTVAMQIMDFFSSEDWVWPNMMIGRYNIATKELEVFGFEDESVIASGVANDGTIVGYTDGLSSVGIIIQAGDSKISLLADVFSEIAEFYYFDFFEGHQVKAISEDGRYIAGFGPRMNPVTTFPSHIEAYVLDTKSESSGIKSVTTKTGKTEYFTIDGRKISAPVNGLNIVKTADGTTKKVLINK